MPTPGANRAKGRKRLSRTRVWKTPDFRNKVAAAQITAALRKLPPDVSHHPNAIIPNPLHLLPALIFLVALAGYSRRKYLMDSAFDHSIFGAVWLNLAAQLAACQSEKLLDGPFVFAQAMNVASYDFIGRGAPG